MEGDGRGAVHPTPGGGGSLRVGGDTYTFEATAENTGGTLTLTEATMPGGASPRGGTPPRSHHRRDRAFWVLEGEVEMIFGGRAFVAGAGSFVFVPRGRLTRPGTWGREPLLMQLLGRDGRTQSELLAAVVLDHSTVSKFLRRMREAGLLAREPAEDDRRVMRVWPSGKGRAVREPLEGMWSELERASVGDLDGETVERFIATSAAIRRAVLERGAASPVPEDRRSRTRTGERA